jgi:diacylglycerol kinase (ATP)
MKPQRTGVARVLHATRYSLIGLTATWRHEAAFRQEVWCAALLFPLIFLFDISGLERALLLAALLLVLVVELLNSAVEAVVDRIGAELHPLSGRAKDAGSAAVFVSILLAAGVWACILL